MQEKIEDIVNQRGVKEKGQLLHFIQDTLDFIQDCKEESIAEQREIFDRIVKRIETLFSIENIQTQVLSLDRILQELYQEVLQRCNFRELSISKTIQEDIRIAADTRMLERVFTGLVKNAIENTPDEGRIAISARPFPHEIRVDIQDFGVGIAKHNQQFIFAGFFHTQDTYLYSSKRQYAFNAGGAGVDLLRIKTLSEQHGFSVDFQSSRCKHIPGDRDQCPGRISHCPFISNQKECFDSGGSTFSLTFPRQDSC